VPYRDEVWTGIEYQVAGHMLWEGMLEEGLAIIRAIHERYDGRVHNPWNEIECGDHYARAMASWGCYLALLGLEYDGPAGRLSFAPRLQQDLFSAAFTAAEGWGVLYQSRALNVQGNGVTVVRGRVRIREIEVALADDHDVDVDVVKERRGVGSAGEEMVAVEAQSRRDGRRLVVRFVRDVDLGPDHSVRLTIVRRDQ
jgi:hypothetical protein